MMISSPSVFLIISIDAEEAFYKIQLSLMINPKQIEYKRKISQYGLPGCKRTCLPMQAMPETGFDPWVRKITWRRSRQPFPVFLPEESHGQRNLAGNSP